MNINRIENLAMKLRVAIRTQAPLTEADQQELIDLCRECIEAKRKILETKQILDKEEIF